MADAREVLDALTRLENDEFAIANGFDRRRDLDYALEDKVTDLSTVLRFIAAKAIGLEKQVYTVEERLAVIEGRLLL